MHQSTCCIPETYTRLYAKYISIFQKKGIIWGLDPFLPNGSFTPGQVDPHFLNNLPSISNCIPRKQPLQVTKVILHPFPRMKSSH